MTFPSDEDGLTATQKDLTLNVIALLRISIENQPQEIAQQSIQAIMAPLTVNDLVQMLWRSVQITDILLNGWYNSLKAQAPDDDDLPPPSKMLDQFIEHVIAQPTIPEGK